MKTKPGKYLKNAQAFKYFVRPKAKEEDILDWVEFNNEGTSAERIEELGKLPHVQRLENVKDKKEAKKNRVVDSSLTKPHTLPKNYEQWLDRIDPQWWILPEDPTPDPKEEARLRLKKLKFEEILRKVEEAKIAKGLKALMHLNRGQV
tara:strand:+ start:59 stop:502 length:444 start_codon:yes stop_codon:yes gene_type:complete